MVFFVLTYRMVVVRGESMDPTYRDGQTILARRRNWFSGPLSRGDVVVLRQDRDIIIKRIYRLPGEEITDPDIVRRSQTSDLKDYYEQPLTQTEKNKPPRLFVPEGYIAILGDNRRVSEDSRIFGPVPLRDVLGVVIASPASGLPDL